MKGMLENFLFDFSHKKSSVLESGVLNQKRFMGMTTAQQRTLDPGDLMRLFDQLFAAEENTRLVRGDGEPVYLPAGGQCSYHQVVFAHGYFASALHEIAHWCIAGPERRLLEDYGYWYAPDGRTAEQQQAFEQVEVKPQALEWILSNACGKAFSVSIDNLNGVATDSEPFKWAVYQQVGRYCRQGLPPRARQLHQVLCEFYATAAELHYAAFNPQAIGLDVKRVANG